jgi:hypothetical protein
MKKRTLVLYLGLPDGVPRLVPDSPMELDIICRLRRVAPIRRESPGD